jgi:hypothetical protein
MIKFKSSSFSHRLYLQGYPELWMKGMDHGSDITLSIFLFLFSHALSGKLLLAGQDFTQLPIKSLFW